MRNHLFFGLVLLAAGSLNRPLIAQSLDPIFASSTIYNPGTVYSAIEQPDGKRVVVGSFSRVNSVATAPLARLTASGSLDAAFQVNVGSASLLSKVNLLTNGQLLLIGGSNSVAAAGITRNGLLRLNADGTADPSLNPSSGPSYNSSPGFIDKVLELPNGQLLVGGYFDHFNGSTAGNIVRLSTTGTVDVTFSSGLGADDEILDMAALSNGKVLVAGLFTSYNGITRNGLARLNADGSLDPTFDASLAQYDGVYNLAVQPDGRILAGGYISVPAGNQTGLCRLLADGTFDSSFTAPGWVSGSTLYSFHGKAFELQPDGKILFITLPISINPGSGVGRLNTNGSLDASFQPGTGPNTRPLSLTRLASGSILVAGGLTDFNGTPDQPLIQLTSTGTVDPAFQPLIQAAGLVTKVVRQADGKLLVGGNFSEINGQPIRRLARFNANGTLDNTFSLNPGLSLSPVGLALQPDGRILVATNAAVRRYFSTGSIDNSFAPFSGINALTHLLLQPDGRVIVNTSTSFSISNSYNLTRLLANGSIDASFTPTLNSGRLSYVQALALQPNGKLLLSGNYTPSSGASYRTVMRLESTGAQDASFVATPITTIAVNAAPADLQVQADGKVLVGGGQFTAVGGTARVGVARLNADGTHDTGFVPPLIFGTIYKLLLQPNNRILLGGSFSGTGLPNYLGRLLPTGAADATYAATAVPNGVVRTLLVQPDGNIIVGGAFTTVGSSAFAALARIIASNVLSVQAPAAVADRTEAWPVPAHEHLNVQTDASAHAESLDLLDMLGRPVRHAELRAGATAASLRCEGLPAGTYLLRVNYAEGVVARRIQVQ